MIKCTFSRYTGYPPRGILLKMNTDNVLMTRVELHKAMSVKIDLADNIRNKMVVLSAEKDEKIELLKKELLKAEQEKDFELASLQRSPGFMSDVQLKQAKSDMKELADMIKAVRNAEKENSEEIPPFNGIL